MNKDEDPASYYRQRAEERRKQREAELAAYEAKLAQEREDRKREREKKRQLDAQEEKWKEERTTKLASDSLKTVAQKLEEEERKLKEAEERAAEIRKKKEEEARKLKEEDEERKRKKEAERKAAEEKARPEEKQRQEQKQKRYLTQDPEFYGADFSRPEAKPELASLASSHPVTRQEDAEKLRERGLVFINALITRTREVGGNDSPQGSFRMPHDSPTRESFSSDGLDARMRQLGAVAPSDGPSDGASSSKAGAAAGAGATPAPRKRFIDTLEAPKIDYTDLFAFETGRRVGITVFRIENLVPIEFDLDGSNDDEDDEDDDEDGSRRGRHSSRARASSSRSSPGSDHDGLPIGGDIALNVADAYIVLRTSRDEHGKLQHAIWYWLGSKASMDKVACAAMHSVNLRNFLECKARVQREVCEEESDEFLSIFRSVRQETDVDRAAESGLYRYEDRKQTPRLFRVVAQPRLHLELVCPSTHSLRSDGAYILDAGTAIHVWQGEACHNSLAAKARLIADKIRQTERNGKSEVVVHEKGADKRKVGDIVGTDYDSQETEASDDAGKDFQPILYAPFGLASFKSPNDIKPVKGAPARALLSDDSCAVLDCGPAEVYLWVGKKSSKDVRDRSMMDLREVLIRRPRKKWAAVLRLVQGLETEAFKLRFADWNDVIPIDMTGGSRGGEIKVDVAALYEEPRTGMNAETVEEAIEYANSVLENKQSFVFEGKKFVKLPEEEKGVFYSEDCYVFLCIYKLLSPSSAKRSAAKAAKEDKKDREYDIECVIYFWQGRHASKLALLTFKFQFQKELERRIDESYGCATKAVFVDQQKEPVALLAHLERMILVHVGRRAARKAAEARRGSEDHDDEDPRRAAANGRLSLSASFATATGARSPVRPTASAATSPSTRHALGKTASGTLLASSHEGLEEDEEEGAFGFSGGEDGGGIFSRNGSHLYHVQTDPTYKSTRAVEVPCTSRSLISRFCFYLDTPQGWYLWIGRGASKDEERRALTIAKKRLCKIPSLLKTVYEQAEPRGFWIDIGDKTAYHAGSGFYYIRAPRFLRCSCTQGYFSVEDVPQFLQSDLRDDSICLLDPHPPNKMFLWTGPLASDVLIKLTKRSIQVYLAHRNDPRDMDTDIIRVTRDKEPLEFRAFYHGWDPRSRKSTEPSSVFARESEVQERERKRKMREAEMRERELAEEEEERRKMQARISRMSELGKLRS